MNRMPNLNATSGGSNNMLLRAKSILANKQIMMILLFLLLFTALATYYYIYHIKPKIKQTYNPNREAEGDNTNKGKQAELMLFYVDWCPHCKTAKPVWEELQNEYKNKTINGYHIIFTDINCTEETPEVESLLNKYKIEGYPTIKLLKDGQIIEYDAKPVKKTLEEFLNTVL